MLTTEIIEILNSNPGKKFALLNLVDETGTTHGRVKSAVNHLRSIECISHDVRPGTKIHEFYITANQYHHYISNHKDDIRVSRQTYTDTENPKKSSVKTVDTDGKLFFLHNIKNSKTLFADSPVLSAIIDDYTRLLGK